MPVGQPVPWNRYKTLKQPHTCIILFCNIYLSIYIYIYIYIYRERERERREREKREREREINRYLIHNS